MAASAVISQPAGATSHSRAWLLAALTFVAIRALPNISYPIARDQATYCVIGQGLLEGKHLYLDFWDNRSPGLAYIYAVIVKLCGAEMWCVGLVDILWLLVISYLVFRFTERYLGPGAAAVAVVVNASWHVWAGYWQAAQAEPLLMVFVFAAFFLMAAEGRWPRLRHFLAGLVFGVAFWTKYNALAFLPLVALVPYLNAGSLDAEPRCVSLLIPWRRWLANFMVFAVGFGTVVGSVLTYFWRVGSWTAFKEIQLVVLPRYAAMALERTPHYWLYAVNQTIALLGPWTEAAAAVALLVAWKLRDLKRLAPIVVAAALGYASLAVQVRFHAYAFETCNPFFAMIWGYLGLKTYQGFRALAHSFATRGWRVARVLVWVVFANLAVWPVPAQVLNVATHYQALATWWREPEAFYAAYPWPNPISHFPDQMRVISYLRKNVKAGDGVFVWGSEPLIYFLTGTRQPTRFVLNLPLVSPWSPPAWRDEVVSDLKKSPPRFLVVARDDAIPYIAYHPWDSEEFLKVYPELATFISDWYEPVEHVRNFEIYGRRGSTQAGPTASAESPLQ
ncbi:MAG: glycosyltransferase family 39 protein [Terriglobia bacterium]